MTIKHCIIHSLSRSQDKGEIKHQLRETENIPEGSIVSLFTQLRQNFQRSAQRQYGLFDPAQTDNPLPGWLKQLNNESMSFTKVSQQLTKHLKSALDSAEEAFDAHLVYVIEALFEETHLYVFWVNHSQAHYIDKELDVESLDFIDASKLAYCFKLDFNQWQIENWQQYLSVIVGRGNKELSQAFLQFIGFIASVNLQQQTHEFLEIVAAYTEQMPVEDSKRCKNQVVDFCVEQDMRGNPVNIRQLSEQLDAAEPERFSDFVRQNQQTPQEEIYAHRSSLKKFVRFYGREKDLSISFSSDMMGDNVLFNPTTGELVFKTVPKPLLQQIAQYLNKE